MNNKITIVFEDKNGDIQTANHYLDDVYGPEDWAKDYEANGLHVLRWHYM